MFEIGTASDYRDLLAKLNTFLTATGSAFGLTYAGTGNGTLTAYKGGASSVAETFVITATSSTNFTVVGSTSGSIGPATVGTLFSHAKLAFTLTAGGTAFVAGDVFTLNTAPAWSAQRALPGAVLSLSSGSGAGGSSGQYSFENVLDGKLAPNSSNYWDMGTMPKLLEFLFPSAITVVEYTILAHTSAAWGPTAWTFEYWDGAAWQVLDTRTGISMGASEKRTFTCASTHSAARYRLNVTAGNTQGYVQAIELHVATGGVDVAAPQYVWMAPGNDGASHVYVGARSFTRADVSYWALEFFGLTGFTASLGLASQPGILGGVYLPLQNSSIPYWFVADGRRVVVVAKVGSNYETAYLGLLESYLTPQQYPYPLVVAGTLSADSTTVFAWNSTFWQSSNATNRHRSPVHSDSNSAGSLQVAVMRLRRPDGSWAPFFATNADGSDTSEAAGWIWPYLCGVGNIDLCVDGVSYALLPVILIDSGPNTWGQLSGLSFVTGQGMTPEALVTVGPISHLAVPNINRTDRNDYFTVRLD